jgi:hypothetical protein
MTLEPCVYQFKFFVRGISPMIWRRILVRSDSSLADLHDVIQLSMGWEGEHLYAFRLHGKSYGTVDGVGKKYEALSALSLRPNERFLYEYNFLTLFKEWKIEIRFERSLAIDPMLLYPHCLAGNRSGPPEECTVTEYLDNEYKFVTEPLAEFAQALLKKDLGKVKRIIEEGKIYNRTNLNRCLLREFSNRRDLTNERKEK